jgi:hypothetical protein
MKRLFQVICIGTMLLICGKARGEDPAPQKPAPILPISNEVSLYHNVDDGGTDRGTTLQIVAINNLNIGTSLNFEFTGDFNWDLTEKDFYDYYIELSLVKEVVPRISVNYQRIYGTFLDDEINQFGVRVRFF